MTILRPHELLTEAGHRPFLDAFTNKTRWYRPVDRQAAVEALLPWAQIESLIANSLVPVERFRVALNGNDLPISMYGDEKNHLRRDAIQAYAIQGATFIINDIGALVPAIGDFATALERDLRCCIRVNCYITFGAVSAFIPHHDAHDVLILQIYGAKRWRSFGARTAFPLTGGRPPIDWEPEWEGQMTPGDLLYLPRGEIHAAIPVTRPSVHLTIGMAEPTGVDFLRWLANKAKDVEVLRRHLGTTLGEEDRAARDQELTRALSELLGRASVADFLADQDRELNPRPLVTLGAGQAGHRFTPGTSLISALRRRLSPDKRQPGEGALVFGGRKIRLSFRSRRVLAEITDHHRITVAALASRLGREAEDGELVASLDDLAAKSLIGIVAD